MKNKFFEVYQDSHWLKLLFLLMLFITSSSIALAQEKTKIFVIFSYLPGSWTIEAATGIKKAFKEHNVDIELEEYVYDYIYVQKNHAQTREINKTLNAIKKYGPQLIIVFDDEAADALMPYLKKGPIPVVVTGINKEIENISWAETDKRNFVIVFERYPFEQSLRMLHMMNPQIKYISILTSSNNSSRIIAHQFIKKFQSYHNIYAGIAIEHITISSSWSVWQGRIKKYKGLDRAFWILVPWNINDSAGNEVDIRQIGKFYNEHSLLPSLGIVNINQKLGFLASFYVTSEDLGYQSALMAIKILTQNVHPSMIPFQTINVARFLINKDKSEPPCKAGS
ncbi:MAG: hypothetical protein HQK50_10205 [Oligoflexia bacterium]|nr:hypothetical protein [Oligoflexia bacterium]